MADGNDLENHSTNSTIDSVSEYVSSLYIDSEVLQSGSIEGIKALSLMNEMEDNAVFPGDSKALLSLEVNGSLNASNIPKKKKFRKMYIAALIALMNAINMGVAVAYSATATEDMKRYNSGVELGTNDVMWIGSLLTIGALFGGLAAGFLSNELGRKGALVFTAIPFLFGWLLITYATSVAYILAGRVFTGFCCGLISVATPMYLVEISTPEVRGLLGASFQLFVVIGVLIVSSMGSVLSWNWLAFSAAVFVVAALVFMLPMPESPRWLVARGKHAEALMAITFLQGDRLDPIAECMAIDEDIRSQPKGSFTMKELLQTTVLKPAVLSLLLMFFQQFSGINAVMFYTVAIFKDAGSTLEPTTATIIVAFVQVMATLLSSVLMDKAGRRLLLLFSGLLMTFSLALLAGFDLGAVNNPPFRVQYGWLPLLSLMFYVAAFSIGFGPIPWLMVAEMTPSRVRSAISGTATGLNWLFAFIVTFTFGNMKETMKDYGTYFMYSSLCLLSCLFTYFFLPETKGKTLEEIQQHFTGSLIKIRSLSQHKKLERM